MSRRFCVLLLMMASVLSVSCAARSDRAEKNEKQEPAAKNDAADGEQHESAREYAEMTAVLQLPEQEAARLKAAFDARDAAFSAWSAEKLKKLNELEAQMMRAARARDLSEVDRIKKQAEPLRDEMRALHKAHQETILEVLSPEQRLDWQGHKLSRRLLELMEPLALTDDQKGQIRKQARAAYQDAAGTPNPDAAGFLALEKSVERSVLAPQQQAAYQAIKKKHPLRSLRK